MVTDSVSISSSEEELVQIVWTNEQSSLFRYEPAHFIISFDVASMLQEVPDADSVQIHLPPSWISQTPTWRPISLATETVSWRITPCERPVGFAVPVRITALCRGVVRLAAERSIAVVIRGSSQFDPTKHVIAVPNNVNGWGVVQPRRDIFECTYGLTLLRETFFNGLYRSIVFLGAANGQYQGGICTGLARVALERSLAEEGDKPSLKEILVWHGRQLCDRALLAATRWLFAPSPRRAFSTFRRELVASGRVSRCFDIGIPTPWRRNLLTSLQSEGHTVVPFAFEQESENEARVKVYDPNDPSAAAEGRSIITFRLAENRYTYPLLPGLADNDKVVIAVTQEAYRRGRTALLASLASMMLFSASRVRKVVGPRATNRVKEWSRRLFSPPRATP